MSTLDSLPIPTAAVLYDVATERPRPTPKRCCLGRRRGL